MGDHLWYEELFVVRGTAVLTVSLKVLSGKRPTPPGVREGLKDTERFPDTEAAVGTTSLCTGGRKGSS